MSLRAFEFVHGNHELDVETQTPHSYVSFGESELKISVELAHVIP